MADRQLKTFTLDDPFDSIMEGIAEDGAVIVRDFVSQEFLKTLQEQLRSDIEAADIGLPDVPPEIQELSGMKTKRFSRLPVRAPVFAELIDHDFMHKWARHSLPFDYWLNTGQAMLVGPGENAQFLHRDILIWPFINELGLKAPEAMLSIVLAVTDFTEEVGATRVVIGSNHWEDFRRKGDPAETVGAVMPAGSAVLYTGKTLHGAGANVTTDKWRFGVQMSFILGWLTPEEASPIGVPWEVAKTFSPRVQRMLGYASHRPEEGASPTNWLVDVMDARRFLGVDFAPPSDSAEKVAERFLL
jgi:hypothetical protein